MLVASGTGASNIGVSSTGGTSLVLATLVLFAGWTGATSTPASSTSATFLAAPVPITFFSCFAQKLAPAWKN